MLLDILTEQLGGDGLKAISRQLGLSQLDTGRALSATLPTLLGALAKNSSNQQGAEALTNALQRDHDGSIFDNLSGFLGNAASGPGDGILKHVLGDRRASVENSLSKNSGLGAEQIGQLLTMVAPLVMGALGKAQRQEGLDAAGVSNLLAGERKRVVRESSAMGFLSLLDSDGDGSVLDDVTGLLGKFLK